MFVWSIYVTYTNNNQQFVLKLPIQEEVKLDEVNFLKRTSVMTCCNYCLSYFQIQECVFFFRFLALMFFV